VPLASLKLDASEHEMSASVGSRPSLYADLYPLVLRVVRATLGADQEQDDVLQATLLQIFRNIGSVRDPASLEGWAAAVAANTARHEIRNRRRRRRIFQAFPEDSRSPSYEPDFDSAFRQAGAKRILERMRARDREVLTLWLAGTGTIAQIAEDLGCSLSTARRRLGRARGALKRIEA
jgi:RNA polymerase sigma-70 factor (ECF subfamily)